MTYLLYLAGAFSILSFAISLYAAARVGRFIRSTDELSWDAIAGITGDLATVKKSIQTLNGRLNGMHSPRLVEETLLAQMQTAKAPVTKQLGG